MHEETPRDPAPDAGASAWHWEQRFTARASTAMLLYVNLLLAVGVLEARYDGLLEPLATLLQLCGWSCGWVLLAAALLASALFIETLIARRPQLQFLLELLLALGTYAVLPHL